MPLWLGYIVYSRPYPTPPPTPPLPPTPPVTPPRPRPPRPPRPRNSGIRLAVSIGIGHLLLILRGFQVFGVFYFGLRALLQSLGLPLL